MLIMLYGRRDADIALWVQEADIALKMFLIINGKALQMNRFVLHSIYCILFMMFTIGFMQYEYNALIRGFKLRSTPPPLSLPISDRYIVPLPPPLLSLPIPDRYKVSLPPSYPFLYQTDIQFPFPSPLLYLPIPDRYIVPLLPPLISLPITNR